jgi:hypothetical protein
MCRDRSTRHYTGRNRGAALATLVMASEAVRLSCMLVASNRQRIRHCRKLRDVSPGAYRRVVTRDRSCNRSHARRSHDHHVSLAVSETSKSESASGTKRKSPALRRRRLGARNRHDYPSSVEFEVTRRPSFPSAQGGLVWAAMRDRVLLARASVRCEALV